MSDISGNNPYHWTFFYREYINDPLHINLTTGHTMLTFDSPEQHSFSEQHKPFSKDFIDGQIYMLSKFSGFFEKIYETGNQPNPKYLLKSMEFLSSELAFEREEAELQSTVDHSRKKKH